jgi:hypothetical protein
MEAQISVIGATLTPAQRDGIACVICAEETGAMIPVGAVDGCQVFAHRPCVPAEGVAERPVVLVVGNASTSVALDDLTAFAFDVADRLQLPAEIAVGRDYRVEDFAGVVLADGWMDSVNSAVLGFEAMAADMFAVASDELYAYDVDNRCGHCGEDGDAAPVLVGNLWTTSVCKPCTATARRYAGARRLTVA